MIICEMNKTHKIVLNKKLINYLTTNELFILKAIIFFFYIFNVFHN